MDTAQLIVTVVSLLLNAAQAMFLAYLQAKFRQYPDRPVDVYIPHDETRPRDAPPLE